MTITDSLEEVVSFRLFSDVRNEVIGIVNDNKELFDSESHFYRVAVLNLIRKFKKGE